MDAVLSWKHTILILRLVGYRSCSYSCSSYMYSASLEASRISAPLGVESFNSMHTTQLHTLLSRQPRPHGHKTFRWK